MRNQHPLKSFIVAIKECRFFAGSNGASMQKLFLLLVIIFGMVPGMHAQYRSAMSTEPLYSPPYESDILSARPIRYFIGAGIGAMAFQHNGTFSPDPLRCDCIFSDKQETKFHYAAEFSIHYPKLRFGLKFLFQYLEFSGNFSYLLNRSALIGLEDGSIDAEFEKSSNVELAYLSFTPSFAWYIPRSTVFLHGGLELAFPMKKEYDNLEKIITPGYSYDSLGTQFEHTFLEKSEIPDVASVRYGLHLGIGVDIKLSNRFYATPQVGATIPLNPISAKHEDWRVTSEFGLLILKYRL
jgi:hypothetical protein